jgi:hypothetical protein
MLLMPKKATVAQAVAPRTVALIPADNLKQVLAGLKANRNRLIREAGEANDAGIEAAKMAKANDLGARISALTGGAAIEG